MTTEKEPPHIKALSPLAIGDYRLLWTASLFFNIGTWLQITAASWLMWELTSSATWVGWMNGSRTLPLLFLALPAGVMADRLDRLKVLSVTQTTMGFVALTMALLTWAGWISPLVLLVLGLGLGVGTAFRAPAWHSLVPEIVPQPMVPTAVALNSVAFNIARAIGPALGGALVAAAGAAAAFGINAASYGLFIGAIVIVRSRLATRTGDTSKVGNAMITGLRYARHTPAFRRILMVSIAFAIGTAVLQAMLPVRTEELGLEVGSYGIMLGSMGAGAAFGGVTLGRSTRRLGDNSIAWSIALTGVAGVVAGLAPSLWLMLPPMFAAGTFWVWTLSSLNSSVQLLAPEWVRGRAVSLWLLSHGGMVPFGAILSGVIADRVGAGSSMVILSTATIVLGLLAIRRGLENPTTVSPPEFTERKVHDHPGEMASADGPVLVSNTWTIPEESLSEFFALMRDVRLARLKTGGTRWLLFQEVGSSDRFSETFLVPSWDEHLSQHQRIDDEMLATLRRARALDESEDGPTSRHFMGIDPDDPRLPTRDGSEHDALHASDGSLPLSVRRVGRSSR